MSNDDGATKKYRSRNWPGALCIALGMAVLLGCGKYETVSSPESLMILRQLYTACSSRSLERLKAVKIRLEAARKNGDTSEEEARDYLNIISRAEQGDWQRAAKEAYQFAKDQVR